jgi:hypothetical protein
VNSEGGKLLAFIDTVEEAGMRWNVGTHRDGTYVLAIFAGTRIFEVSAKTIGEAVTAIGKKMVEAGMKGAPSA